MPKVRKYKNYDYSKSYEEIKEDSISRQFDSLQDDSSAKMRGRRPRSKAGSEKSDNKSVYSQRDFLEDNAEITSSYWQDPANKEAGDSLSGYNPQQEDTEPISQPEAAAPNGTGKQEKVEKNQKNQKREKRNQETLTVQSQLQLIPPPSQPQPDQKLQFRGDEQPPLDQFNLNDQQGFIYPDDDNEQFILEFNPTQRKYEEPQEVFRSSYIHSNQYIRIEVYLDERRRLMEDRIRALLTRRNPGKTWSSNSSSQFKGQFPREDRRCGLGPLKRRKKRRTAITAKVLQQVQLMFRHYEQQQKFYGTPVYRRRLTLKSMGDSLCISQTEIKHLYEEYCTDPLFTMRFSKLQPEGLSGAAWQQLQQMRLKFLEELVGRNCVMTQQEIADQMNQCQDLLTRDRDGHLQPITRKIVQSLLKKGNYSRKKVQMVPKNRNSPQTLENRYHYCCKYLQLLSIPQAEIYFLDESRFNMMTVRDRGWSKKGIPATKITVNSKGKDIILLALISISGLCWYQLSDGYNAAAFTISMDKAGKLLSQRGANEHRYIIMDNCPIHNRQNLKNIEQLHGLKIIYLPPYTPMLNPIEYWFNEVKSNLRQKTYKTRLEMKNNLEAIISRFRQKSFQNYYDCIKPYLELGIRRELCKA